MYGGLQKKRTNLVKTIIILNPLCIRLKNGNSAQTCRAKYTSFPIRYIR